VKKESPAQLNVVSHAGRKDLERDDAVQAGIAGLVHLAHSACANPVEDFVGPEPIGWRQSHRDSPALADRLSVRAPGRS
jgi:hypothetical protein